MTIMQAVYWLIASVGNLVGLYLVNEHASTINVLFLLFTLGYSAIGFHDLFFSHHNLNRLYPVVAYIRYFLESYRVEIQQYFIANDTEEQPFNREQRSLVYQRAKNVRDTIAFGTQLAKRFHSSQFLGMSPSNPASLAHAATLGRHWRPGRTAALEAAKFSEIYTKRPNILSSALQLDS